MRARPVLHGDLLRADLFNPGARQLLVTFRQRLAQPGSFDAPQPVRRFVQAGYAHLHLQSRWNDWYINAETPVLDRQITQGVVVACGTVPIARVLRQNARRQAELRRHGDQMPQVLLDPFKPMDLLNARLIQSVFPGLTLCRLAGSGHPASRVLREGGHFAALQSELLQGAVEPRKIRALHRDSRRDSPLYWTTLGEIAARHGRSALARQARSQALALKAGDGGK